MSKIGHIWRFSEESIEYFWESIFDTYFENRDRKALSLQKLFDVTLIRELPSSYIEILSWELKRFNLEIDHKWETNPVSCQNVYCHRDKLDWSHQSIVANVWRQTGELLIHEKLRGKVIDSVVLTKWDIFTFDHFDNWHSVEYTGNPQSFMMIVRASVKNIL